MHARTALAATLLSLAALTGCSSSGDDTKADVAACETAMREQLQQAVDAGSTATPGTRPDECNGVSTKTLEQITGDLMTEQLGNAVESALPSATEPTGITDDCRAFIESELLDSSDSIDATPGYNACGDMSDAELDAAIEDVTNDLIEEDTTPAP